MGLRPESCSDVFYEMLRGDAHSVLGPKEINLCSCLQALESLVGFNVVWIAFLCSARGFLPF